MAGSAAAAALGLLAGAPTVAVTGGDDGGGVRYLNVRPCGTVAAISIVVPFEDQAPPTDDGGETTGCAHALRPRKAAGGEAA